MIPPDLERKLCGSAEREGKGLDARVEELDLEASIVDRLLLPDQLIQPLFANRAVALGVDVDSMRSTRRFAVDQHAEAHRSSTRRPHDEMEVARMKAVR